MLFDLLKKKPEMPAPGAALPGRPEPIPTAETHFVNGRPLKGPHPQGLAQAMFGMGCFWGVERMFWKLPGVWMTAAGYAGGEATTVPITFTGDHLELNFSTSGAGEVRVELQDDKGQPLPGFSRDDCDVLIGDRLDKTVSWRGQSSVARYIGKTVRLKFSLIDADVYAFHFPSPKP